MNPTTPPTANDKRKLFRKLMNDPALLVLPGVFDGYSTRLVEQAGFPASERLRIGALTAGSAGNAPRNEEAEAVFDERTVQPEAAARERIEPGD